MVPKTQRESWFAALVLSVELRWSDTWSSRASPCGCHSPWQRGVPTPTPPPGKLLLAEARVLRMDALSPSHTTSNKSIGSSWVAGGRQGDKLPGSHRMQAGEGIFACACYLANGRLQHCAPAPRLGKLVATSSAGDPFLQVTGKEWAGIDL